LNRLRQTPQAIHRKNLSANQFGADPVIPVLSEIIYVESRDTEVWVYATEGRHYRNKTGISQWENLLGEDFIRVHRSFVVMKESIQDTLSVSLTLEDGTSIPVSRKYREAVSMLFS
jgi:DNA-binding LytR/AlgR family response regulator